MAADNGHGLWEWIVSIPTANVIAFCAGIPGALLGAYTYFITRIDTRRKDERASQTERNKELRAQEQGILEWTRSELTSARQQLNLNDIASRKQLIETEDAKDLWEARARWWYSRAHELLGQLKEARDLVQNYETAVGGLIARNVIPDPGFDELPEERPKLPAQIGDIEGDA